MKARRLLVVILVVAVTQAVIHTGRCEARPDYMGDLAQYDQEIRSAGDSLSSVPSHGFSGLSDSLEIGVVGKYDRHLISFTMADSVFRISGSLIFTFPEGFDLSPIDSIESVGYADDDPSNIDPLFSSFQIAGGSIQLDFDTVGSLPIDGSVITISLDSILSAYNADEYTIVASSLDSADNLIAGPTVSSGFTLDPDELASIEIHPSGVQEVEAGGTILYSCRGWDQYGNGRFDFVPEWEVMPIVPASLPTGEISADGVFLARLRGSSSISCRVGELTDMSAPVYVFPGDFDHYEVAGFATAVVAGSSLTGFISVAATDLFGNVLADFDRAVWFVASDPLATISPSSSGPYSFTSGDSASTTFPGANFTFRSAGLQTIYLTDGEVDSDEFRILVNPGPVHSFDYSVPTNVTAGIPFEISIANVQDTAGNPIDVFVEVELTEPGESPGGDPPLISPFAVIGGSGSGEQTLVRAGLAQIRMTLADTVVTSQDISVSHAAAESFHFHISSPQFIGQPFSDSASLEVFDRFGNIAADFNASIDTVRIEPDGQGSTSPSVIDSDSSFIGGFCDLVLLGLEYEGVERYLTFTATSDLGVTGKSNTIEMEFTDLTWLSVEPTQLHTGDTLRAFVTIVNYGTLPAVVRDVTLLSTQGVMSVMSHSSDLPFTVGAKSSRVDTLATIIPDDFSAGWTKFSASFEGTYNDLPISGECEYLDSIRILRRRPLTYDSLSLSPRVVSLAESYSFICKVVNSGADNIVLDTSSSILIAAPDMTTFEFSLKDPAYVPAINEPVTLFFDDGVIEAGHGSGWSSIELRLRGLQGFSSYNDTIALCDSLLLQTPSSLRYQEESFQPSFAFRGTEITPSLSLINDGEAPLTVLTTQAVLRLTSGADEISFTLSVSPHIVIVSGQSVLAFETKTVPLSFPLSGNHITLELTGTENGHSRNVNLSLGDDLVDFRRQAMVRLSSVSVAAPNVPKVNTLQPFDVVISMSNEGDEAVESISVALGSDGASEFNDFAEIESLAVGEIDSVIISVAASSDPNPAELFTAEIVSATGAITGLPGLILAPLDNTAAVSIQRPAEISVSARVDAPPNAVGGVLSIGQSFHVAASFVNDGQASIGYGRVKLSLGDTGFLTDDDTLVTYAIDDIIGWDIKAPMDVGFYEISVDLYDTPIDSNTGDPAIVRNSSDPIQLAVEKEDLLLRVTHEFYSRELISPGEQFDIMNLTCTAAAGSPEAEIRLDEIRLNLTDRNGRSVVADEVLVGAKALHDGRTYESILSGAEVVFSFEGSLIINPGASEELKLSCTVNPGYSLPSLFIELDSTGITATDVTHDIEGSRVAVVGRDGSALSVTYGYGVVADNLDMSFINYPNPFAAGDEETNIVYFLPTPADVTLEIFTLIGEKVFSEDIRSGAPGAMGGEKNVLIWDGRNSRGEVVRNGIYIAVLKLSTGAEARRKVAVVK